MMSKTPLYDAHIGCDAKIVDFHGWAMPIHYGSQLDEHHAVRKNAGIFDVSHMTILDILGAGGRLFLRKLLTNDVDKIKHSGEALYSCMCNQHGGIIDDLIVYQRSPDNYRVVLNSATRDRDLAWIQEISNGFSVGLQERRELAMIAVQGPKAISIAMEVLDPHYADAISTLKPFQCVDVDEIFLARTGYTGEDGLEIMVPATQVADYWQKFTDAGMVPCGLGARDTLRLEAGLMLYGQDMDETTTPLESALGWTVTWQPEDRDFIGMGALLSQKQHGIERKMVGLILEERGIMRTGQVVRLPDDGEGFITSGTWSPTLEKSIALARVPANVGEQVQVEIRNKLISAKVVKPRFVKHGEPLI